MYFVLIQAEYLLSGKRRCRILRRMRCSSRGFGFHFLIKKTLLQVLNDSIQLIDVSLVLLLKKRKEKRGIRLGIC
jgi:hypothetical protein